MTRWTRRSLLIGGIVIALPVVGLAASKFWSRVSFRSLAGPSNLSLLLSLYSPSAAVRALGKQYLEQTGSTPLASLRRLEKHNWITRAAETDYHIAIASALDQACRDDFRTGCVHCIDGWVMAQTELDVAALCSIS
jgi:hypothetical protein